jgi:hypothetical protein
MGIALIATMVGMQPAFLGIFYDFLIFYQLWISRNIDLETQK